MLRNNRPQKEFENYVTIIGSVTPTWYAIYLVCAVCARVSCTDTTIFVTLVE